MEDFNEDPSKWAEAREALDTMRIIQFSDTILIMLPISNANISVPVLFWLFGYIQMLCYSFMMDGLPIRGGIAFGDVVFNNDIFAGKTIIEAHDFTTKLDLAAVAISKTLAEKLDAKELLKPCIDYGFVVEYRTPLKSEKEEDTYLVSPVFPGELPADLCQWIVRSFSAHNKKLGLSVDRKIRNTEIFMRYSMSRREPPKEQIDRGPLAEEATNNK